VVVDPRFAAVYWAFVAGLLMLAAVVLWLVGFRSPAIPIALAMGGACGAWFGWIMSRR
jgi:hypothetical protein